MNTNRRETVKDIIVRHLHNINGQGGTDLNSKVITNVDDEFDIAELIMAVEFKTIGNVDVTGTTINVLGEMTVNEFITWVDSHLTVK